MMTIQSLYKILIFSLLQLLVVIPVAYAEVAVDFKDDSSFSISVGGYLATTNTTLRIDGNNGNVGTTFNAEEELDWNDREFSPFISFKYDFNKRHSLLASYWSIRRDGVRELTANLTIDDVTYIFGTTIDSEFITDIYRVTYGYNIYRSENFNFALLAGLHITNLKFNIRAVGTGGGSAQTAADAVAPLPTFGVSASYRISKKWYVSGWFQGLSLEYDNYKGKMLNASVAATFKPFDHWAFSAGATTFDINISSTNTNARGEFDYEYVGPFVAAHWAF